MSGVPYWLTQPIVPLAWCWRIERRDGVQIGLTTHDRDLMIKGLTYSASPGMRPAAIRQTEGLGGDRMDIDGGLTTNALSAESLALGQWNGARLVLMVADWEAADTRNIVIAEGRLGEVAVQGAAFSAELRGGSDWLEQAIVPVTSAGCRADFGDRHCGVPLVEVTVRRQILSANGPVITVADAPEAMTHGHVRWLSGPLRGQDMAIIAQDGDALRLAEAPAVSITAGTAVALVAGCDKRAETCRSRYRNMINFRGEPHLPGTDLLTRYPGG